MLSDKPIPPVERLIVALDDHVLQQVAEARLDGALVAAVDLDVVGDGAELPHLAVGLHQHHARYIFAGFSTIDALADLFHQIAEICFHRSFNSESALTTDPPLAHMEQLH